MAPRQQKRIEPRSQLFRTINAEVQPKTEAEIPKKEKTTTRTTLPPREPVLAIKGGTNLPTCQPSHIFSIWFSR
jgi:hypothetical protein